MADTASLVQGSATLALNTGDYEVKEIDLSSPPPDALTHMPDYGEDRIVRTEDKDRQATLQMRVTGADWDDVHNNVAEIRRWLQEAARAEVDAATDTVYLQLKRSDSNSTATNATNNQIRYGWVDGDNVFTPEGQKSEQALIVFLHLVLTPYGEALAVIPLKNQLYNSPSFTEQSGVAGLAAGWSAFLVPTLSLNTTNWLIGGQSQKIEGDGLAEDGVVSDTITNAADVAAAGFIWAYVVAKEWYVSLLDVDAPSTLDTVVMDSSGTNADAGFSRVDVAGNTWYRYTVSEAAIPGTNDIALRVNLKTAEAGSIYIDAAYLQLGITAAPDAWSSSCAIDNRDDYATTSQATENYINYIDVALIPGDAPAQMLLTNTFTNAGIDYEQVWGLEQDSTPRSSGAPDVGEKAASIPFSLNSDDLTQLVAEGTFDATQGAGAYHDGNRARFTEDAGNVGCTLVWTFTASQRAIIAGREFKVYVAALSDVDTPTLALSINTGGGSVQSRTAGIYAAANYELKNIGIFRPSPLMNSEAASAALSLYIVIGSGTVTDGKYVEVDAIFLMPVDKGAIVTKQWIDGVATHIDGPRNSSYSDFGLSDYVGQPFDLLPGFTMNRLRVLNYDQATDDYAIADQFPITLEITPRTRHLLGTL